MGEKMSLEQAMRRAFSLGQTYWAQADSESWSQNKKADETRERFNELLSETLDAHLTQPAQAVDVGAEDRFEQYVKTLIDKAPDVQKLGERLAHWLDDDQFNNIEPILLGIARQLAALPNANGKEG